MIPELVQYMRHSSLEAVGCFVLGGVTGKLLIRAVAWFQRGAR